MLKAKLLALAVFAAVFAAVLLTDNAANPHARAFSSGPPAGFTRAPGELDCSDCHTTPAQSAGSIALDVPRTYTPGQTYDITVGHTTSDPTRVRWGFQLTALDASDQKAGALAAADDLTQVVEGQGPFPSRQYVEHTAKGTFPGQQNNASWKFRWTAPSSDVGPVTFYAAGNQANGDNNSSGDNVYFTFAASSFQAPAPDFTVSVTPASATFAQGGGSSYNVTVTPTGGFTGQVALHATGLPPGSSTSFTPAVLDITDASPKTSLFSLGSSFTTPTGSFTLTFTASGGGITRAAQAAAVVVKAQDADITLAQAISPNPAQVGQDIRFTYTVTNKGPGEASTPSLAVRLPLNVGAFVRGEGACSLAVGPDSINYFCVFPNLQPGQSGSIDFRLQPTAPGTFNVSATARSLVDDPLPADNTVSASIPVAPFGGGPLMTVSNLGVRTAVAGLNQPTGMAFIGAEDFLVLEKASGRVVRVRGGRTRGTVLDLAVNSASERGLLGIEPHPDFSSNGFVYLFWTESSTGADTTAVDEVPLLGNRVDRFVWDGAALRFDRTLLRLRALQQDAGQPSRGNHNGGVLRFGPDGKLYVVVGDEGRRGLLQNITSGPVPDDQFGGPEPDDAHLAGVILRLNADGTTPADNPFFNAQTNLTGQAAENVRKVFAYGVRNSFGMDFDPLGGFLWTQENGDDSFDEINRVEAGFNGGWIQLMGPSSRVAEFKAIETARAGGLQQNRWPPSNIADTPAEALARLFSLPGSRYTEPEFSWKFAVAPSPVGFARGAGLGPQYAGDLFVGASRTTLLGGYLFRLKLSADRKSVATTDARLADGVADNSDKFDVTESESLVVGRDFGITTDIRTGPNGRLYVVSLSQGAVYEIFSRPTLFVARLTGGQETPPNNSQAMGTATLLLDAAETSALVTLRLSGLSARETNAHVHGPAPAGQSAAPVFDLPAAGDFTDFRINLTPGQVSDLKAGLFYINVHTEAFPAGEIRGQFGRSDASSVVRFDVSDERVGEGAGSKTINVVRFGDISAPATINYATTGGLADERTDYTTARGTLRFAPGETSKSFDILITDDAFREPDEFFNLALTVTGDGSAIADPASGRIEITDNDPAFTTTNPIDETRFFVRQHYHDFFSREPDAEGLAFWTNVIESCGTDAQCREVTRINVSAAFFLSIEFQETGYLVYRLYEESFDRQPRFLEFISDTQEIGRGVVVNQGDWQARLDANREAFAEAWVRRPAFRSVYDGLSNAQYVQRLYANAGLTPTAEEVSALAAALDTHAKTRARVLLDVAATPAFIDAEKNRAFVLMEYFGYLRRDPDPEGYNHWLTKLEQFNGNFVRAEMVKAFLASEEYRRRFGP